MTRRFIPSIVPSAPPSQVRDKAGSPQKSLDNTFEAVPVAVEAPRPMDPYLMRARFPELWSGYLRDFYRRPEHIAEEFGVTFQTACNWLGGVSRPTGDKVLKEIMDHPTRLREYAAAHKDDAA